MQQSRQRKTIKPVVTALLGALGAALGALLFFALLPSSSIQAATQIAALPEPLAQTAAASLTGTQETAGAAGTALIVVEFAAGDTAVRPITLAGPIRGRWALLRSGMDVYTLQRLMGHADLTVLRGYLDLVTDDLQRSHDAHGALAHMMK